MGELKLFAPYKRVLWREYATPILTYVALLSVNVFAAAFVFIANSSSRTPGENSPISTNSFARVGPRYPRLGLKRRPTEMPRGYEPEDFLTPRDASAELEPTTEQPSRDHVAREQAVDDRSPEATQNHGRNGTPPVEPRTIFEVRDRTYRLRNSETATMVELGKFHAIAQEDLAEFAYGGDKGRMRPNIENLLRQGLVEIKSIPHEEMGSRKLFTSPRMAIVSSPRRRGPANIRFSTTDSPNPEKPTTMPISTGFIKRPQRRSRGREAEISVQFSTTRRRSASTTISRSSVLAGLLPRTNISLPNGMVFKSFEERFLFPTFGLNTKHATARGLVWTSNSPPVTTGEEIWPKKSAPDSPSAPVQKMLRNSGPCWISVN